ncbi:hypothetical protein [Stigmatella erecta]|uniref:Uncharacterized protein n=1 Tax=Stigmatella erecta TaxID=83460 RepID=A0A1I0JC84_9BACT|nr:hypothetical protein [Stigmatella erecta]SEU06947.1 hypothetical protein SAMN05443639_107100 [Stigmatella erecta]
MQLRKTMWMLTALSAMSLMMTACGGDDEIASCTSDSQCSEDEVCQTAAGVCVQTCEQASDCPDSAKNCEPLSSTDTRKVCKCTVGTSFCADEYGEGFTCSASTRVCTDDDDTNPNPNPGGSCSGTAQSTCGYGQFCSSGTCTAVPAPTCANFDPTKGGKTPVWNASTSSGPIIYSVTRESYSGDSFCSGNTTAKARVQAYIPSSSTLTFPDQKSALPGLFYVTVNGQPQDGDALIRQSEYTRSSDGKTVDFIMNFCPGQSSTTLSIGLYFDNGNEICAQINK